MSTDNLTVVRSFLEPVDVTGRTVIGLAVPYNRPTEVSDNGRTHYLESWAPGVFAKTIAQRGPRAVKATMTSQHERTRLPIGAASQLTETPDGLMAELQISRTRDGDEALELIKDGVIDGMSIEASALRSRPDYLDGKRVTTRTEAKLNVISMVPFPAFAEARIHAVRSATTPQLSVARARLAVALARS